jgi:hypothetical protein
MPIKLVIAGGLLLLASACTVEEPGYAYGSPRYSSGIGYTGVYYGSPGYYNGYGEREIRVR